MTSKSKGKKKLSLSAVSPDTSTLMEMHTYCRPAWSKTEEEFIDKYIMPLNPYVDAIGNLIYQISDSPTTLWSCHTDTVHRNDGMQTVAFKSGQLYLTKSATKTSNCLGADDTGGVWLLLEMIKAKIPGLYIFHRAEETGGQGSQWIAKETPQLLENITHAIAFDRTGTKDIITHQLGMCASKDFAIDLASRLKMNHIPDNTGVFTDTANYTKIIAECTNVSIGYYANHSRDEVLDVDYLLHLKAAVLAADFTNLTVTREPGEDDYSSDYYPASYTSWSNYGKGDTFHDDFNRLVEEYPDVARELLQSYGVDYDEFLQAVWDAGYYLPHH